MLLAKEEIRGKLAHQIVKSRLKPFPFCFCGERREVHEEEVGDFPRDTVSAV
jgi:hypothetical protein